MSDDENGPWGRSAAQVEADSKEYEHYLRHGNEFEIEEAIVAASKYGHEELIPAIQVHLSHANPGIRLEAIRGMGRFGGQTYAERALSIHRTDPVAEVRAIALYEWAVCVSQPLHLTLTFLYQSLSSTEHPPVVVDDALRAIGSLTRKFGTKEDHQTLVDNKIDLLNDDEMIPGDAIPWVLVHDYLAKAGVELPHSD